MDILFYYYLLFEKKKLLSTPEILEILNDRNILNPKEDGRNKSGF